MAWAERRPNGRWRGAYRLNGQRHVTAGLYLSRRSAERAAEDELADALLERRAPSAELSWGAWSERWLRRRQHAVATTTYANDLPRVSKWLLPQWADVPLAEISTKAVRAWVGDLVADGVSAGSIHQIVNLFSASLTMAVEDELLPANPCRGVKLPRLPEAPERYFTPEEIDRALAWLNPPYSFAVRLLCETGLRFGELAGLHWQHVDLDRARLDVAVAWARRGRLMTPTKGRHRRAVPLSDAGVALLRQIRGRAAAAERCEQPHRGTAPCRSGLVLPGPEGGPLDANNMRNRHWIPALELAGIGHGRQHDLRHTFASWMVQRGVALSDVAEVLGHTDAYVTRRYAHLADSHLDRLRSVLNGIRLSESATPDATAVENRQQLRLVKPAD